jgi:universal stress protein E
METLSKILVIIEPEQDIQLALDKAVRLARESGAALELLICDHNPYLEDGYYFDPLQARQLREEHVANHRQLLEEMATVIRAQGFTVSVDALWGNPPYKRIIDKVLSSKPDLLVQSSRHHEKISRLLLSHQDWQLLRYCPCPLLLVKDKPWPAHPVFVVAVDPTHVNDKPAELDNQLTAAGQTFAELTEGALHIFHSCYQPPVSGLYPVKVDLDLYKQKTAEILSNFSLSDEQLHIEQDEVKKSLPALLKRLDASVLVMGAVSRSALDRFLVGSTAERLLDKVGQDVLVLKPQGFRDTVKKAMPQNL